MRLFYVIVVVYVTAMISCDDKNWESECRNSALDIVYDSPYSGLDYFNNPLEAIECAKLNNKHTLIYFTTLSATRSPANTPQANLNRRTRKILTDSFNLSVVIVDDATPLTVNDYSDLLLYCDGYSPDKTLKTVGNVNAAFQICTCKANYQPYFVILDKNGVTIKCVDRLGLKLN